MTELSRSEVTEGISKNILRVARFSKISPEQFMADYLKIYPNIDVRTVADIYNGIELPKRATEGSAGYDFYSTVSLTLVPRQSIIVPTGIRAQIDIGWVLKLYPRSSYGMKYRLQMDNTTGIIDSDYYYASNEGHIMMKITNDSTTKAELDLHVGDRFAQGIFTPFGITYDDNVDTKRTGGLGSTGV